MDILHDDCIFNRTKAPIFLKVIFKVISYIHMLSLHPREEERAPTAIGWKRFEMVTQNLFNRFGYELTFFELTHELTN